MPFDPIAPEDRWPRKENDELAHATQRYHNAVQDEIHALRKLKKLDADLASVKPTDLIAIREELLQQTPRQKEVMSTGIGQNAKTIFNTQPREWGWKKKTEEIPEENDHENWYRTRRKIKEPQKLPYVAQGYIQKVKDAKVAIAEILKKHLEAESKLDDLQRSDTLDAVMKDIDYIFARSLSQSELTAIREEILRQIG